MVSDQRVAGQQDDSGRAAGQRSGEETLGKQAAKSLGWVSVIAYSNRLTGFVTTLILARLVAPDAFGMVAIATMAIEFVNIMKDMGMSQALIYRREETQIAGSTAFFLLISVNVSLFVLLCAAAPFFSTFFSEPDVTPVIIVMSSSLVWFSLRAVPDALIRKRMAFRKLLVPSIVPVVVASVLSISMAYLGFGVWSLVARTLVIEILSTALIWRFSTFRPTWTFDSAIAKELLAYGRYIIGGSIVAVCLYNVDKFYLGKFADVSALGLYVLAYTLANVPVAEIGHLVCRVMFPTLSKVNDDMLRFKGALLKTLELSGMVSIPMGVGLATYGPDLVRTFFEPVWWSMTLPLQLLAAAATCRSVSVLLHEACKAAGKPQIVQWALLYRLCLVGILGFVGVQVYGIVGLAGSILIAYATALVGESLTLGRFVSMRAVEFLQSLAWPLGLSLAAIPTSHWLVTRFLSDASPVRLGVGCTLAVLVFVGLAAQFRRTLIRSAWVTATS